MSRPARHTERKQTLAVLTREILDHRNKTAGSLCEIGVRLQRIRDDELWSDGGFASFGEYLEHEVGFARTTAYKLMRIAQHFNAQIVERYGVKSMRPRPRNIPGTCLRHRSGSGTIAVGLSASRCTRRRSWRSVRRSG